MRFGGNKLLVLMLLVAGCGTRDSAPDTDGTWVGTITTEGNVTTVVNESGSVWGGTATLVEEMSISVEAGQNVVSLGATQDYLSFASLWATQDYLYVLDVQSRVLRVFDHDGKWVRNIGREGRSPGEFRYPDTVMVAEDGNAFVFDAHSMRITVYSTSGELVETWSVGPGYAPVLTNDGRVFMMVRHPGADRASHDDDMEGVQEFDATGAVGSFVSSGILYRDRIAPSVTPPETFRTDLPYAPTETVTFGPIGAFVSGNRGVYAFSVEWLDGRRLEVERREYPVPVPGELAESLRRRITTRVRRRIPGWAWAGTEIPEYKRFFESITVSRDGRILLFREGPSHRINGCEADTSDPSEPFSKCWRTEYFWDVFNSEGVFLGRVDSPVGRLAEPFVRDDLWFIAVLDEAGTIMVKRYRLVLPGER